MGIEGIEKVEGMRGRFSRSGGCDVLLSTGSLFIKLSFGFGLFRSCLVLVLLGWRGPGMGLLYFTSHIFGFFYTFFSSLLSPFAFAWPFVFVFPVWAVFIHHVDCYLVFQNVSPLFYFCLYSTFASTSTLLFSASISTSLHLLTA